MIVKIHKTEDKRMLLVVCDKELLGQKFEEGNQQLNLAAEFYNGESKTSKEVADLMRNCYMMNLVGARSIKLALDEDLINKDNIKTISEIPYAQVVTPN